MLVGNRTPSTGSYWCVVVQLTVHMIGHGRRESHNYDMVAVLMPRTLNRPPYQPQNIMSLFPDEDVLTKEIESWKGFVNCIPEEGRQVFMKMLNDCYRYSTAINAKCQPFPSEPVIMSIIITA